MPNGTDSYHPHPEYPDYPDFEGLNNRQIRFLLALQQFLRSWPDEKVVEEFEVTHKVMREMIAKVKDCGTFQFIAYDHQGEGKDRSVTKIPLIVQKDKRPVTDNIPILGCWWCYDPSCDCWELCGSC